MIKRYIKPLSFLLITLVVAAGVVWSLSHQKPKVPAYLQQMGGDFTLKSPQGKLSLHQFHGDVVLIYFGYTHCPDICPTALGVIAEAIERLPDSYQKHAHGIFISLDPRRDSPAITEQFAHFFSPTIHGVTGSPQVLAAIAKAWRLSYNVPEHPENQQHYAVEHSNFIYLINGEGKVAALFDEKTEAKTITDAMLTWL